MPTGPPGRAALGHSSALISRTSTGWRIRFTALRMPPFVRGTLMGLMLIHLRRVDW